MGIEWGAGAELNEGAKGIGDLVGRTGAKGGDGGAVHDESIGVK